MQEKLFHWAIIPIFISVLKLNWVHSFLFLLLWPKIHAKKQCKGGKICFCSVLEMAQSGKESTVAGAWGLACSHLADHEAGSKGEHLAWAPTHKARLPVTHFCQQSPFPKGWISQNDTISFGLNVQTAEPVVDISNANYPTDSVRTVKLYKTTCQ